MAQHFSVIVPLYNKEKYIRKAIESVLAQSHTAFEVIIVDDGSTDKSADIANAISDSRVRVISQANAGESAARNTGILAAKNRYLAFLDGDDLWKEHHLRELNKLIAEFPGAGLYCMRYQFIEPEGELRLPVWFGLKKRGYVDRYFHCVARGDQIATSSSVCIPKSIFENIGMFSLGDKLGADQDMWARIALDYSIAVGMEPTAIYFRHSDEQRVCNSGNYQHELPYSKRLQAMLDSSLIADERYNDIREYIKTGLFTLVSMNLRKGDKSAARTILKDPRLRYKNIRFVLWLIVSSMPVSISKMVFKIVSVARKTPRSALKLRSNA